MKLALNFYLLAAFLFLVSLSAENMTEKITAFTGAFDKEALHKFSEKNNRSHIILTDEKVCGMEDLDNVRFHPVFFQASSMDDFKILQILKLMRTLKGDILVCAGNQNGVPAFFKLLYAVIFENMPKEQAIQNIPASIPDRNKLCKYLEKCDTTDLKDKILECGKYKRQADWAVKVDVPEFDNMYKVSDKLYRGEQPDKAGFKRLQKMGIENIISLRWHNIDPPIGKDVKLNYYHAPVSLILNEDNTSPEIDKELVSVLKTINSTEKPFFIHCFHGSDRTGLVTAAYRIIVQGWSKEAAMNEMKNGGFEFHFDRYRDYIKKMDADKMRTAVLEKIKMRTF